MARKPGMPRNQGERKTIEALWLRCLNCEAPLIGATQSMLFCGSYCQEESKYVRYHRRVLRDGRINQQDVAGALQTRRALLLGGGYNQRARQLSPKVRESVFTRTGGRCAKCGAEATEIDHIYSTFPDGLNHPDNLQPLCRSCHDLKTQAGMVPLFELSDVDRAAAERRIFEWEMRIQTPTPRRPSDDELNWEKVWRQLSRERRELLFVTPTTGRYGVLRDGNGYAVVDAVSRAAFGLFKTPQEALEAAERAASADHPILA